MSRPKQRLIVFTRLPEAGKNKTRLIPALGAEGAAAFHDRLARHAVGRASAFVLCSADTELEIRVTGGSTMNGCDWLGGARWRIQGEGDLGQRLKCACDEAFDDGADRVILIGTDCPSLSFDHYKEAFEALERSDVVIGPAVDGGYFLIGMKSRCPELFSGISWGGCEVFDQTVSRLRDFGLSFKVLEALPDVDLPEDLEEGEKALSVGQSVTIIVPALNEEAVIEATLKRLTEEEPAEIMVSDGGSSDATRQLARRSGARLIEGATGRALQMNLAAKSATSEFLLFIHADTLPPRGFLELIVEGLNRPGVVAGAFRLGVDDGVKEAELIERLVDLRCDVFGSSYGDQGLFLRRSVFERVGGFPECPVLEDVRFVRTLRKFGRFVTVDSRVTTSGRRWKEGGLIATFLRHQLILAAGLLGLPPKVIARLR